MLTADCRTGRPAAKRPPVIHHLYGIDIRTPWAVAGVEGRADGPWDVEFVEGDAETLAGAAAHVPSGQANWWAQHATPPDGSTYRRWTGLFEFLVEPDARRIHARLLEAGCHEALLAYLFVDALSFSMVRLGWEPLHATAVLTPHGVAAFLGESGDGKSTMGALLVQAGSRLVTDDMLILTPHHEGYMAQAGPPRLKLYREIAARIFGPDRDGVPMNPATEKLIIRLGEHETAREASPLTALYLLHEERAGGAHEQPVMGRLSPAAALPRILAGAAAHYPSEPARLRRQFDFVTRLVQRVPIKTFSYRRDKDTMSTVRDAVLADLERSTG